MLEIFLRDWQTKRLDLEQFKDTYRQNHNKLQPLVKLCWARGMTDDHYNKYKIVTWYISVYDI